MLFYVKWNAKTETQSVYTQRILYPIRNTLTFRYPLPLPSLLLPQQFIALRIFASTFSHDFEFSENHLVGFLDEILPNRHWERERIAVREN